MIIPYNVDLWDADLIDHQWCLEPDMDKICRHVKRLSVSATPNICQYIHSFCREPDVRKFYVWW